MAEWTCKTVALIAELENQQKSLQASAARLTSKELVPLNEQMIKFSNHLIDKIELCVWGTECAEYGQENGQQKWLRLSQEYDAKFRKDDIHSLCYDGKYGYRYHYVSCELKFPRLRDSVVFIYRKHRINRDCWDLIRFLFSFLSSSFLI